jgi:hypothetical protein
MVRRLRLRAREDFESAERGVLAIMVSSPLQFFLVCRSVEIALSAVNGFERLARQASSLPAKSLRVNGGFSEPPSKRIEGGGTPKGAPW